MERPNRREQKGKVLKVVGLINRSLGANPGKKHVTLAPNKETKLQQQK